MANLLLIRHGQASFGAENYDQLSPLGQRQADITGEYLNATGVILGAAYSGDLSRQRETASRALAGLDNPPELQIDARFNEVRNDEQLEVLSPILLERDPAFKALVDRSETESKAFQKVIAAVFNEWVRPGCEVEGMQSWQDYHAGVTSALQAVMDSAQSGTDSAIFSSGGTIATMVAHVLKLPADRVYEFYEPVFNCSITRVIFSRDRSSLSTYNEISHLQLLSAELNERLVTYR
jgi:broad specificity phosphatase PhoE